MDVPKHVASQPQTTLSARNQKGTESAKAEHYGVMENTGGAQLLHRGLDP